MDLDLSNKYGTFLARIKTWSGNFRAASFDWDLVDEERRDRFRKVRPGWSDEDFPKMLNAPKDWPEAPPFVCSRLAWRCYGRGYILLSSHQSISGVVRSRLLIKR